VVGIVSQRDLFRASISSVLGFDRGKEHEWMGRIHVQDIMTKDVVTVDVEAGLVEVMDKFITEQIGCLPVTDQKGALVGLLTETDCLRCFRDLLKAGKFKDVLS
jgi:acetoin utilization protein AcuB